MAQHAYAFGDPNAFQNARRAAYETVDPQFSAMQETLEKAQKPRAPSRDFESVISWVCWMLGFSPAHFGIVHTEAADVIMVTPNGHFAVVECCTGALDVSKLGRLHARAQAVRTALSKSGVQHLRVIPVFVTALSLDEVSAGVEHAEKNGIYLLTREAIDRLIVRTLFLPNADQLFEEGERAIGEASQRRSQDTLFAINQ
jgi:hypothetical protein